MPQLETQNRVGPFAGQAGGLPGLPVTSPPSAAQAEAFQRVMGTFKQAASLRPVGGAARRPDGVAATPPGRPVGRPTVGELTRRAASPERETARPAEPREAIKRPEPEQKSRDAAARHDATYQKNAAPGRDRSIAQETSREASTGTPGRLDETVAPETRARDEVVVADDVSREADGHDDAGPATEAEAKPVKGETDRPLDDGPCGSSETAEATAAHPDQASTAIDPTAAMATLMADPAWLVMVQNPVGPALAVNGGASTATEDLRNPAAVSPGSLSGLPTASAGTDPSTAAATGPVTGAESFSTATNTGITKSATPALEAALFQELRVQSLEVSREIAPGPGAPVVEASASPEATSTAGPVAMAGVAVARPLQGGRPGEGGSTGQEQGGREQETPDQPVVSATGNIPLEAPSAEGEVMESHVREAGDGVGASEAIAAPGLREAARPEGIMAPGPGVRDSREVLARPAQGPESNQAPRPVQEVVKSYLASSSKDQVSSELRLQLSPEHLGRIEVRVRAQEGVVTAIIRVEQPHAHQTIEQQFGDLKQTLLDQGVRLDKVEVQLANDPRHREQQTDLGGGAWQQGRQQPGQENRTFQGRGRANGWDDEEPTTLQFADGLPMMRVGSGQAGGFDTRA